MLDLRVVILKTWLWITELWKSLWVISLSKHVVLSCLILSRIFKLEKNWEFGWLFSCKTKTGHRIIQRSMMVDAFRWDYHTVHVLSSFCFLFSGAIVTLLVPLVYSESLFTRYIYVLCMCMMRVYTSFSFMVVSILFYHVPFLDGMIDIILSFLVC